MCKSITNQRVTGSSGCRLAWYTVVSHSVFTTALQPASGYFFLSVCKYLLQTMCIFLQNFKEMRCDSFIGDSQKVFLVPFSSIENFESIGHCSLDWL